MASRGLLRRKRGAAVALDENAQGFVGPLRPKRRRKATDTTVAVDIGLPDVFSAHSPGPLLAHLASVPCFTPSGEPGTWQSCKSKKIIAIEGKEHEFDTVSHLVSERLTAWGITSDLKKGEAAWEHCNLMLIAAGISKPSVTAVGPMLRWWVSGYARYLTAV